MLTRPLRVSFTPFLLAVGLLWLGVGCTPSGPKALLQGVEQLRKGNYEAAIAKLQLAKDLLPSDARAWNYLGLAYHGAGQHGEAIIAYQRAQQLDPNLAEARYNLGELFFEQGNPVSAADEFTVFTALQPKSVEGWLRLGDAQLQNQRLDRAQTSYHLALNLKRETPAAFNGLGLILLQRKNPRDAYRYFVEAVKYDPDYTPAILNMAVVAQTQLDSPPTALGKYREYLAKAPNAANAAEVRTVIGQLQSTLSPRSVTLAAAQAPPSATASSNITARVAAATNVPPKLTNVAAAAISNTVRVAGARTNPPTASPPAAPEATAKTTNQPSVRLATVDSPKPNTAPVTNTAATPPAGRTHTAGAAPANPTAATVPTTGRSAVEPPLEDVAVTETVLATEPDITPAGEIQKPATAPTPPSDSPAPVDTAQPEERKRGFFKRINPVNLFRSDKPEEPARRPAGNVTPLPPETSTSNESSVTPAGSSTAMVARTDRPEVRPMPAATSGSRYEYGRVRRPTAGDRTSAERLFERGIGAQSRQDPAGAITFFEAAVQADGTYFAAHYNLGLINYAGGQWFKALSAFETALVLDPNSAEARYNFALTLQKAGFAPDAARELERLLTQNARDARAALLLGKVYSEDLKDVPSARRQYQRVLELEPQHPQAAAIRSWLSKHP